MASVILINPNTNTATTAMMTAIVAGRLSTVGMDVVGCTARRGPAMITDPVGLTAAADEVLHSATAAVHDVPDVAAVLIAAFGDPGRDAVARTIGVPVVGIAEAAMRAASRGGRPFGIVSPAPALSDAVRDLAVRYDCAETLTGIRAVHVAPEVIAGEPDVLVEAMVSLGRECVDVDGAQAVIVGGGPLGSVAEPIAARLDVVTIAPLVAACDEVIARLSESTST